LKVSGDRFKSPSPDDAMSYQALVDCETLSRHLADPDWIIVDCRFDLADPEAGEREYRESHVAGAVYAHLDHDLSGPPLTDSGRHPLPAPEALVALFSRLGIEAGKQVVVYDSAGGALAAARVWWMLRYMGHTAVAVLDGGWQAWQAAALPTAGGIETNPPAAFEGQPQRPWLVLLDEVSEAELLVDVRDPARYRGEVEPIDPVAGHIPGAVNYPLQNNLGPDGRFLPPEQLRRQLKVVLGETAPEEAVFYCGSGVSACQSILAMAHAGLPPGRLYAGSWSDWIRESGK
jgi:thiosulfate/3-mercaptopyruvate sulfurtransferase